MLSILDSKIDNLEPETPQRELASQVSHKALLKHRNLVLSPVKKGMDEFFETQS